MQRDRSGGLVERFLGMFSPYAAMSRELQAVLQLDRTPSCRSDHGRLEILLRGAGLASESMENRIDLALRLAEAARPLLRSQRKGEQRRLASRAVAVVFEDEAIVGNGIATTRFTYLASHDNDNDNDNEAIRQRQERDGPMSEIYETLWPW
jgi:hypothetical protein